MEILAMPSLCDSTDFGLNIDANNRDRARKLFGKHPKLLSIRNNAMLYRVGDAHAGSIFLWDKELELIVYFIQYKTKRTKFHGQSVTQTALWRALIGAGTRDITRHVVFDVLLKQYPAIMSDRIQTEAGRDFWTRLMSDALSDGYTVALIDFNQRSLKPLLSQSDLRLWATNDDGAWAWHSLKHQGIRFMIYRKELA